MYIAIIVNRKDVNDLSVYHDKMSSISSRFTLRYTCDFVGSWVKLDESYKNGNERPFSIHNGEMESLLAEAAEDRAAGTQSHRPRYLEYQVLILK